MKSMFRTRLILAIIGTLLQEVAIVVIWLWGLPEAGIYPPVWLLAIVMVLWGVYATTAFMIVTKALRREEVIGLPAMIGGKGKVLSPLAPEGQVMVQGEIWTARSVEGNMKAGEKILVVGQEALKLYVRRLGQD